MRAAWITILAVSLFAANPFLTAQQKTPPPGKIRFMLHGNMSHHLPTEEYLRFVERIRPDVLIMGVFDQRLYSLAAPPADARGKRPAALDPVEHLLKWKEVAQRLHRSGIKLIGQMELNVLTDRPADREQATGWFGFYNQSWNDRLLGSRPTKTALELLEVPDLDHAPKAGSDAHALCGCRVNTKALHGCINNPRWREVHKLMVKAAIAHGVDGFLTNRNFFGHCGCEHCVKGFRTWLGKRYTAGELKTRFGIADLARHSLSCVVGIHREIDGVPAELVLEKQRFSKHMVQDFFEDVYVRHGRDKLNKDLLLGQWNHLAFFDELHLDKGHLPPATRTTFGHVAADERWSLPPDLWARGEDLIWYCNWGTTQNTQLDKDFAGDTVLYGKYVRTMAQGKSYVINKYDYYRPRVTMAEAAALGYATNAVSTHWQTEEDREAVIRYFDFLRKHDDLYRGVVPLAEAGLVFPRRAIHAGDAAPVEYVEAAGRALIRRHVLFDMLADDMLAQTPLEKYCVLVVTGAEYFEKQEREALARYAAQGGRILLLDVAREDRQRPGAIGTWASQIVADPPPLGFPAQKLAGVRPDRLKGDPDGGVKPAAAPSRELFIKTLLTENDKKLFSGCDAPWSVEMHAYHQSAQKRLVIHLVNYNHKENAPGKSVTAREAPLAVAPFQVRLKVPDGFQARSLRFHSPDDLAAHDIEFRQRDGFVEFQVPGFLVYGVCVIGTM